LYKQSEWGISILAKGFPGGKSRLNGIQTEDFQEGSRETQKSQNRSSEMVVNALRYQNRLDGASNFVVWKAKILPILDRYRIRHFSLKTIAIPLDSTENENYEEVMARAKCIILDGVKDRVVPHIAEKGKEI